MGRKKSAIYETRICPMCSNTFEIYGKSTKIHCSKKCAQSNPEHKAKMVAAIKKNWDTVHGGKAPMQRDSVITKRQINWERLPDNVKQEIQLKRDYTNINRYGSKNFNNITKARETKLSKYGNANYNGSSKRTDTKYKEILTIWSHLIPLFTRDEFKGVDGVKYKFKCVYCDTVIESNIDNGYIPSCKCTRENTPIQKSKGEVEIAEYIKSIIPGIRIEMGNRSILKGNEIDIYLPEFKLGIEFNGVYWHSDQFRDKEYHIKKTKSAISMGVHLLHITDYDWYMKKDIIKSLIRNKLNKSIKVFARKCYIKPIKSKDKNIFLDECHIQGKCRSSINIGLYTKDTHTLVAVMTFSPSRYDKNYQYELVRYAVKLNYNIIGGFSKMLMNFVNEYSPKNILSYCNRSYSYGNVYYKNNFKLIGVTDPNYTYIKNTTLLPREACQKHKLKNILPNFNPNISEYENMRLNGYHRLWDCGNYKFVYTT